MAAFCPNCGTARTNDARFCPSCGSDLGAPRSETPPKRRSRRASNPLAVLILAVVVIGGSLYLLNNTRAGISLKCHVLGDIGACFVETVSEQTQLEKILQDIGDSI
jgi:uncharacterized protein (DUF983 family)